MSAHRKITTRRKLAGIAAGLAVVAVVPALTLTGSAAPVATTADAGTGRAESCVVDTAGGCTVPHGLGAKPSAVLATASGSNGGSFAVVNPQNTNATSYRVTFFRPGGSRWPAGTAMSYYVHFDVSDAPPVTTPPPTTEPPPTTPPPTTEPPSPTPTPTDTASPVKTCTNPSFTTTSTDNNGDGRTFGPYFVHNNMWNNHSGSGPVGTYTMNVCNYDNWYELVTQQPSTVSPGAVRAYPNVHKDYNDAPLSQIQSADFAAKAPHCAGCVYNVAFDVWINADFTNELMIWTENFGQRPAGSRLADADQDPANGTSNLATIGGKTYQVWKSGGATSQGGIFTYVADPVQTHGNMPLNLFFTDLERRGWIPANSTTWQVDFGVETVSTAGTQQRFDFTDFEIHEN